MIRYSPDGRFSIWAQPGSDLDYGFDWAKRGYLEPGVTITGSTWDVPEGVTMTQDMISSDGTITAAFLAVPLDGNGNDYVCTNRVVRSDGGNDSRTVTLICKVW